MVNAADLKSAGFLILVGSTPTVRTNKFMRLIITKPNGEVYALKTSEILYQAKQIYFPKELELTTENLDTIENRVVYTDRETGEIKNFDVNNIPSVDEVVPTGTWDAPRQTIEQVLNEDIVILDVMPMSKGDYGNVWLLALAADPDADLNSGEGFFTFPISGGVMCEKIAKAKGFDVERDDDEKVIKFIKTKRPDRLPVRGKTVRKAASEKGRNPYYDFVDRNWTPEKE